MVWPVVLLITPCLGAVVHAMKLHCALHAEKHGPLGMMINDVRRKMNTVILEPVTS